MMRSAYGYGVHAGAEGLRALLSPDVLLAAAMCGIVVGVGD